MSMKFDRLFDLLDQKGISTYMLRKEKIIGQGTLHRLRINESVSTDTIATFCELLDCQPNDIMEFTKDE